VLFVKFVVSLSLINEEFLTTNDANYLESLMRGRSGNHSYFLIRALREIRG